MTDALHAVAGLVLCTLMAARTRMLRGSVTSRSLWVALAVLGAVQLEQVDVVYRGVDNILGRPGSAALIAHGLTVVAAAATRELHNSLQPRSTTLSARATVSEPLGSRVATRRRHWASRWSGVRAVRRHYRWAAAALVMMAGIYAAWPPRSTSPSLAGRSEYYDPSVPTALVWAAYLAYLTWALAGILTSTRRTARQAPPGPLRTGLRVGVAGIAMGFGYVVLKVAVISTWLDGRGPMVVHADAVSEALVLSCTLLLLGVASTYEAISARAAALWLAAQQRRSARRLGPLARTLRRDTAGGGYGLPANSQQLRLIMAVTDIRDGQRGLRGFIDPNEVVRARSVARRRGHPPDRADLLAEACGMRLAQLARSAGDRSRPSVLREAAGGSDLEQEVRCLELLAAAYRHPFVRGYVRQRTQQRTAPPAPTRNPRRGLRDADQDRTVTPRAS